MGGMPSGSCESYDYLDGTRSVGQLLPGWYDAPRNIDNGCDPDNEHSAASRNWQVLLGIRSGIFHDFVVSFYLRRAAGPKLFV